jgi:hypothetical protein
MPHDNPHIHMISDSFDIKDFLEAVHKKDPAEIISLANQEATSAWRLACRQKKHGDLRHDLPGQYEHALEELIWFLRTPSTYRPFNISEEIFGRFLDLRHQIAS